VAGTTRAWELSWAGFYGATFIASKNTQAGSFDCIELNFARHEVILRGRPLTGLMDGLHTMTLPEVRIVDEKFINDSIADDAHPVDRLPFSAKTKDVCDVAASLGQSGQRNAGLTSRSSSTANISICFIFPWLLVSSVSQIFRLIFINFLRKHLCLFVNIFITNML
jgi:hypothetical protein